MSNPKWDSADYTALYLTISTSSQPMVLQKDLDNLERWSHTWDMEFNPSECRVIHITRSKNPIPTRYTLHNCILDSVSSAKYLSKKANNTLGFLRRNIKIHFESLKSSAYKVLVRPQLECCSTVWCPFSDSNISYNLKLSNVELPDGSNMTMDRLLVSQTWCSPYIGVGSTNGE